MNFVLDNWYLIFLALASGVMLLPTGAARPVVSGWVLEADRAIAVPLAQWTEDGAASASAIPAGAPVDAEALTGTVGGAVPPTALTDIITVTKAYSSAVGAGAVVSELFFERPAELLRHIDAFLRQPAAHPAGSVIPTARP